MKKALIVAVSLLAVFFILISIQKTPKLEIPAPETATDLRFIDKAGWQSRKFVLRMNDTPESCRSFAVSLMQEQMGEKIEIKEEDFSSFPVSWKGFPSWFDVDQSVENGTLITGNDWIYAVVDQNRGRLYYYYSH